MLYSIFFNDLADKTCLKWSKKITFTVGGDTITITTTTMESTALTMDIITTTIDTIIEDGDAKGKSIIWFSVFIFQYKQLDLSSRWIESVFFLTILMFVNYTCISMKFVYLLL